MASPQTAGIGTAALVGLPAGWGVLSSGVQQQAQEAAANYNAATLSQEATASQNVAASNEADILRKGSAAVGEQAASFGESGIGTGRTVQGVEKQSLTNTRMDALNTWYGGELEAKGLNEQADWQKYAAQEAHYNIVPSMVTGGIGAGTAGLMAGAQSYGAISALA